VTEKESCLNAINMGKGVGSMKVLIQLRGPLKKYGPGEEIFEHDINEEPGTLREIIDKLNIPSSSVSFVSIDGEKAGFDKQLRGGEKIVVYPRVAGG